MKVCFRVEASNKAGMGHLMESISVAKSLKKRTGCEILFLINNFPPALDILKKLNYKIKIMEEKSENGEIKLISDVIKNEGAEVLIVDLLDKNNSYFRQLKRLVKTLVVILDDDEHRVVTADVVVNFNIAQNENFYSKYSGTVYCIGPKYMPMPEELHEEWKKEKIIPRVCKTIFVNQGGSDPFGLTVKIIRALELLDLNQKIVVIVGPAVSDIHKKEIKRLIPQLKNDYVFKWGITNDKLYKIMSESDLAITAAGNTLYELAVFGVPSVIICHHKKHNVVAEKFAEKKAAVNLGIGKYLDLEKIAGTVIEILNSKKKRLEISTNIKKIVDGLGSGRIAEEVLRVCQKY